MELGAKVHEVRNLLNPDLEVRRRGGGRQETLWKGTEADCLPMLITNVPAQKRDDFPVSDKKEQFCDKRKMLFEKAWGLIGSARGRPDAQLSGPADPGAGFIPRPLGL